MSDESDLSECDDDVWFEEEPSSDTLNAQTNAQTTTSTRSYLEQCIEQRAHANRVRATWKRPEMTLREGEPLCMMVVDVDYTIASRHSNRPVLRAVGVTEQGGSLVAHVHNAQPYFWAQMAHEGVPLPDCEGFAVALKRAIKKYAEATNRTRDLGTGYDSWPREPELHLSVHERVNIKYYQFERKTPTFRVEIESPTLVSLAATVMQRGVYYANHIHTFRTFETNLPFVQRWMCDNNMVGCGWLQMTQWTLRPVATCIATKGVSLEIDVDVDDVTGFSIDEKPQIVDALRTLSFDIECMSDNGVFPTADVCPIIQIGNTMRDQQHGRWPQRVIFALDLVEPLSGHDDVLSFADERTLLRAWYEFVLEFDPDVVTGFNINNFDLPYVVNRLISLEMETFCLGRLIDRPTKSKESNFSSNQSGTRAQMDTNMQGRAQFDMYIYFQRDVNLRLPSYTLNACAEYFLGDQKQDLHHTLIPVRQRQGPAGRRNLATYCLKDAELADALLKRSCALINSIEMARVTGVTLTLLMTRGQSIRVICQIQRIIGPMGKYNHMLLIVPTKEKTETFDYQGATVIEPIKGFYKEPIVTLDFASLYPSIMMAHNLCYSTLLRKEDVVRMDSSEYTRTPTGDCFVKKSTRQGILPLILQELLSARKMAKNDLKKEKAKGDEADQTLLGVFDGRQLALKVSANSVYGFTGANVGQLPCVEIANSVTGFGRQMIEATKQCVETTYTVANNYSHDAIVVYGDTDSVMIKFGPADLETCMKLGTQAAPYITEKLFIKPIKLEFEKGYKPYLLLAKKRYAGWKHEEGDVVGKFDSKGLENGRRDNCKLVRDVVQSTLQEMLTRPQEEWLFLAAKRAAADLYTNRIEFHKIVQTSGLSKPPEEYDNPPAHVRLAKRMAERDPASAPLVGSRVAYVIIEGGKKTKKSDLSEDPLYALENNLLINTAHYIERLREPLFRILSMVDKNGEYMRSIFEGSASRKRVQEMPSSSPMFAFVPRRARCCICHACMPPDRKAFCASCRPQAEDYRKQLYSERDAAERTVREYLEHCRQCQKANQIESVPQSGCSNNSSNGTSGTSGTSGEDLTQVECANHDCDRFYKRIQVRVDATKVAERARNFALDW